MTAETVEAATDPLGPDDAAPYGYMIDRATGEKRAKKKPGRQVVRDDDAPAAPAGAPPTLEELRAGGATRLHGKDRAPGSDPKTNRTKRERSTFDPSSVPPFRAGPIARGMNLLYLRVGRLVRFADPALGTAIMMTAQKESEEDLTVGEIWEEIARTNVRVRAVCLRLISGGQWSRLFLAHSPILLALLAKPGVAKRFPLARFLQAWGEGADDGQADDVAGGSAGQGSIFDGVSPEEMQTAMAMAAQMMGQFTAPGRAPNAPRGPVAGEGFRFPPPGEWSDAA